MSFPWEASETASKSASTSISGASTPRNYNYGKKLHPDFAGFSPDRLEMGGRRCLTPNNFRTEIATGSAPGITVSPTTQRSPIHRMRTDIHPILTHQPQGIPSREGYYPIKGYLVYNVKESRGMFKKSNEVTPKINAVRPDSASLQHSIYARKYSDVH